jgi:hypothetical protein
VVLVVLRIDLSHRGRSARTIPASKAASRAARRGLTNRPLRRELVMAAALIS